MNECHHHTRNKCISQHMKQSFIQTTIMYVDYRRSTPHPSAVSTQRFPFCGFILMNQLTARGEPFPRAGGCCVMCCASQSEAIRAGGVMEGLIRAGGVMEGLIRAGGVMEGLVRTGGVMEGLVRAGGVMEGLVRAGG
ncbi:hypothetical protein PO909_000228, partial [Leuciscus waleckii]